MRRPEAGHRRHHADFRQAYDSRPRTADEGGARSALWVQLFADIDRAVERLRIGLVAADELYPQLLSSVRAAIRRHAERFMASRA